MTLIKLLSPYAAILFNVVVVLGMVCAILDVKKRFKMSPGLVFWMLGALGITFIHVVSVLFAGITVVYISSLGYAVLVISYFASNVSCF